MPELTFDPSRIRALREGLGWTQEEFAERVGVSRVAIAAWEAGQYEPNLKSLLRVVNITGAKLETFFVAAETV